LIRTLPYLVFVFLPLFLNNVPAEVISFRDVSNTSGIHFQHVGGSKEKRYIFDTMSGGVVLFDYDNDGLIDVYLVNGSTLEILEGKAAPVRDALFHNLGGGRFEDVTTKARVGDTGWGMGGCAADYDNDGWTDLYVTNFGRNTLYRNNGNGTFSDVTEKAGVGDRRWSTGAAWGDYDRDGYVDLFVANYVAIDLKNLPQLPEGSKYCQYRGIPVMCGPRGLKGAPDSLYHNNGDGTFTEVAKTAGVADESEYYGLGVVWGDYDDDGDPDLYVANDAVPSYLYRNEGNNRFTEIGLLSGTAVNEDGKEQASMGVDLADYDGDGKLDLYRTNFSDDSDTLYRNEGRDSFRDVTRKAGLFEPTWNTLAWATGFFDFDNDSDRDIYVVNGHVYPQVDRFPLNTTYRQRTLLFDNVGNGTFREIGLSSGASLQTPKCGRGGAYADLDNDGDLDLVISNIDDTPTVLLNDGGNRRHWFRFRLKGKKSNRDAVGARVTITVQGRKQTGEVKAGSSYCSQNELTLHFGLGSASQVDQVDIRWPSGLKEHFENLPVDRLSRHTEGEKDLE
jgi:enediyne biosynthesis protein E4